MVESKIIIAYQNAEDSRAGIESLIDYAFLLKEAGRLDDYVYQKLCVVLRKERDEQDKIVNELEKDVLRAGLW